MSPRRWNALVRHGSLLVLVAAALVISAPAEAQGHGGGPGGGGGGEETTGNNFSYPVVLVGGATLTLREPPVGSDYTFGGYSWLGWVVTNTDEQLACDPAVLPCPPPDIDPLTVERIYLQKDPASVWQANHIASAVPVTATHLDWSDNLESTVWNASSVVRVETIPFAAATGALGFQMWWASGKGVDEVWWARASDTESPLPTGYPFSPNYATIYSTDTWPSLQKLEEGAGSLDARPVTSGYAWNAAEHKWDGVLGKTVRIEPFTPEISVGGKAIYGFNWNLKRQVMTLPDTKDGWWRLTFSTSENTILFNLNGKGPIFTPPEVSAPADQTFFPQADLDNNLTYIDIYIKAGRGGGGGH
ncbi:MAG: hypothetical protein ACM3O7_09795 [Acidobacteriota bacterium]